MINLKLSHEVGFMNLLSLKLEEILKKNYSREQFCQNLFLSNLMFSIIILSKLVEKNPNLFLFEKKNSRLNGKIQICVYYEKKKKKGDLREKFRSVFIMKEKYEI